MTIWIIVAICGFLFVFFPLLSLWITHRTKTVGTEQVSNSSFSELKASVLYLQTALPTILFLLGALGFTTYEVVINKVTTSVEQRVNKLIERDKIEAWTTDITDFREMAENHARSIAAISTNIDSTMMNIANQQFLRLLPKGTIIPFKGSRNEIDFNYWLICDGANGTPDLRDRFILAGTFAQAGSKGGSSSHSHTATTIPKGQVRKSKVLEFPHKDGNIKDFTVERHDHGFNGIESSVTVARSDHLPPFYRLVFLMKIK
jgi:hypothetical protein